MAAAVFTPETPKNEFPSSVTPPGRHHYPALDGLRGGAFLAVFVAHFYTMVVPDTPLAWGGWLGVDLFFVLSGFLITGILYDSLGRPRYFRNFYIRRTLRIFPLYYITWIVFLLLTPWLHPLWTRFDIARVFYYGNLMDFQAAHHPEISAGGFMFYTPSGHYTGFNTGALWSLCLEEQFYLIWPFVVFLLKDRRRIMRVCEVAIPASLVLNTALLLWALHHGVDRMFLYNATYAHISPMLFGAWLAMWLRGRAQGATVRPAVYVSLIAVPALVLVVVLGRVVRTFDITHPFIPTLGYMCSGLMATGWVLAAVQPEGSLKRLFSPRWLTFIGTISYGLYIIHGFLMGAFQHHLPDFERHHAALLMPVTAFGVTLTMAWLSYRYYESPWLRLKDRLAPSMPVRVTGRDRLGPPAAGQPWPVSRTGQEETRPSAPAPEAAEQSSEPTVRSRVPAPLQTMGRKD